MFAILYSLNNKFSKKPKNRKKTNCYFGVDAKFAIAYIYIDISTQMLFHSRFIYEAFKDSTNYLTNIVCRRYDHMRQRHLFLNLLFQLNGTMLFHILYDTMSWG